MIINIFKGSGFKSEVSDDNLICSASYDGVSVSNPEIGIIGKNKGISNEDVIDLIEMSLIQYNLKEEINNVFIEGGFF